MIERFTEHSQAWVTFSYVSFVGACLIVGAGIYMMPVDYWIRAFLMIGMIMLIQSSINITKTLRDNYEGARLINRLEDAKTEKLIRDVSETPTGD